jgi:hypothetical protein
MADIDAEIDGRVRAVLPKAIGNYQDIKIKRAEFIGELDIKAS